MPEYAWKSLTIEGRKNSGKSLANDLLDLTDKLESNGQMLLKAREVKPLFSLGAQKVTTIQLINFTLMLSLMLNAGVTILDALGAIGEAENHGGLRRIILQLKDALNSGKTFSQALQAHPKVFDEVYVNLIQAGEQSGQLNEVLEGLTENLKWQQEMAGQTKKALIYPVIVTVVITAVLMFLLGYVVPQIATLLKTLRVELPLPTIMLIAMSDFISTHWLAILIGFCAIPLAFYITQKFSTSFRTYLERIKLQLPIMGPIIKKIALARFSYVLAMLYGAGITVVDSLLIVEKVVGNTTMAKAVQLARAKIVGGKNLSTAFAGSDLFPAMVVSMLRVGEATGSLDTALKNASGLYTREARESVENLQATLQPILTVVLGLILALIMIFTLGPLYDSVFKIVRK